MGIPSCNLKHWSRVTIYCYEKNANCKECNYFPDEYKKECKVKEHVPLLYKKFGEPNVENFYKIELKRMKKYKSFFNLALDIGISETALKNFLEDKKCNKKTIEKIKKYMEDIQC